MKRWISMLVVVCMLMLNASMAFAGTDLYLSNKDMSTIAAYHVETYYEGEGIELGKRQYKLSGENDEKVAVLFPLTKEGETTGYVVVDARKNGFGICESTVDPHAWEKIADALRSKTVYYTFPAGIKATNEVDKKAALRSNMEMAPVRSVAGLPEATNYTQAQQIELMEQELDQKAPLQNRAAIMQATSNETVMLSGNPDKYFLYIYDSSGFYYGGNQAWFDPNKAPHGQKRGCGTTAAANIAAHMSRYVSGAGDLYGEDSKSKSDFVNHMHDMYNYVTPWYWGVPTISSMISGMKDFASAKGVAIDDVLPRYNLNTLSEKSRFVKAGLQQDAPIAMLQYWNDDGYDWHWVTITKYFRNVTTDDRFIAVSSWGERYSFNFKLLYENQMVYFEVE